VIISQNRFKVIAGPMGAMESSDELDSVADQVAEAFGVSSPQQSGLELLSEWIEASQAKRILVLTGAGISTGMST
jgi:copper homeostasis protein CutC